MSRILSVAMALLLALSAFLGWRLLRAHEAIGADSETIVAKDRELTRLNAQLVAIALTARMNEAFHAELQRKSEAIATASATRTLTHNEVINGKAENKAWADARLPPDIIRLHNRPTLTGAADYLQYLSEGNALRAAGQQSAD